MNMPAQKYHVKPWLRANNNMYTAFIVIYVQRIISYKKWKCGCHLELLGLLKCGRSVRQLWHPLTVQTSYWLPYISLFWSTYRCLYSIICLLFHTSIGCITKPGDYRLQTCIDVMIAAIATWRHPSLTAIKRAYRPSGHYPNYSADTLSFICVTSTNLVIGYP